MLVSVNNTFLLRKPLPCKTAASTPLQPLVPCSESLCSKLILRSSFCSQRPLAVWGRATHPLWVYYIAAQRASSFYSIAHFRMHDLVVNGQLPATPVGPDAPARGHGRPPGSGGKVPRAQTTQGFNPYTKLN